MTCCMMGLRLSFLRLFFPVFVQYSFSSYSSLYLSNFLSFHSLKIEIFRPRFLHNHASWNGHIGFAGWWWLVVWWDWEPGFSCLFFPVLVQFSFHPYFEEWNFLSKISPQPCKLEWSYLVWMLMTTYCFVRLSISLPLVICPCICPIFFLSILWRMKFFVKDFSTTLQARMVIFGKQVDDKLYRGMENQSSPAYWYSSLFLSNFLFFHTLKNKMFRQRVLNIHASQNGHIWYVCWWQLVSWE